MTALVRRWAALLSVMAGATIALMMSAGAASARDAHVRSFDGTEILVHFFPAAGLKPHHRVPTVLMGPGWGQLGSTDQNSKTSTAGGVIGIGVLRHHGYNVLTWDPRGFGGSGGTVEVDSPKFEGRDVSAMISYVARRPEALLDKPGDPRIGMVGGSYGGGIQLVSAAIDHRIDAIVPDIAWHSLATSLARNQTAKSGWGVPLYLAAASAHARLDPEIVTSANLEMMSFVEPQSVLNFYAARGPGNLVDKIIAPTLLIQGTVDTLFTLNEAVENYSALRANHVPVKMLWFCGGHGVCLTNPGDTGRIQRDTLSWLGRYLKRQPQVRTGPGFEWLDQNGHSYSAPSYPLAPAGSLLGHGGGTLSLIGTGGSGPAPLPPSSTGILGSLGGNFAAAEATNAVNVPIAAPARKSLIMGAPRLSFSYEGTAPRANARVLAQILDKQTGKVLGNQITPIVADLNGVRHSTSLPLEIVTATALHSSRFALQLVAQSKLYDTHAQGGSITFSNVKVSLPIVKLPNQGANGLSKRRAVRGAS
jgi:ABC-2 type transport system ATP-binding protein